MRANIGKTNHDGAKSNRRSPSAQRSLRHLCALLAPGLAIVTLCWGTAWAVAPSDDFSQRSPQAQNGMGRPNDTIANINGQDVNVFNLNFMMRFPVEVGLRYPENAGIDMALVRYYDSNAWHWESHTCGGVNAQGQAIVGGRYFRVRRENPMGLGWNLGFGRIIRAHVAEDDCLAGFSDVYPWTYVEPDGTQHHLTLFAGNEYGSGDGSHIRAIQEVSGSTVVGWTVAFPDGRRERLEHWRLVWLGIAISSS